MSNPRIPYRLSTDFPKLAPPNGKPLIVHVVANIEHWPFDRPMPRKILPGPHGVERHPDVPNFAWVEYGMRCGLPRLLRILEERQLPVTAAMNASVIETYPTAAEAILKADWEFMGHGYIQRALQAEDDEVPVIRKTLSILEGFTGKKTRGWLGPGQSQTEHTADILKEHGIDYVCDWVLDDLPLWMRTKHGPLVSVPYTFELNDVVLWAIDKHSSDERIKRVEDTLTCFDRELVDQPRVLTLPLHPHVEGVPHRAPNLERVLDRLMARPDTVFMTGAQIADWFLSLDVKDPLL